MNHSFVSDYFAVGVIAYELMTGRVPLLAHRDPIMADQEIKLEISCSPNKFNYAKLKSLKIGAMKLQILSINLSKENLKIGLDIMV